MASKREAWLSLLPSDPRPALLASDEPFARFAAMTAVLGKSEDDAEVRGARKAVVADPHVRALFDRLPDWESGFTFGGHNSPAFPPKWRGPGRKNDACLQVTVEALRLFGLVNVSERLRQLGAAARTLLGAWRNRANEKPYMFGHGRRFVDGKWPPTWYDASAVLEALMPYPSIWKGKTDSTEDRTSTAEIVQALATTFGVDGMVTPRSCYKGFEGYSFGQKKNPSPWATARVCGLLRAFASIAGERGMETGH